MPSTDPTNVGSFGNKTRTEVSSPAEPKQASTWNLEDSSVWWITYFWDPSNSSGLFSKPGNVLLLTSVPFFAGAYFGYRMPTEQLEDLIQGNNCVKNATDKGVHKAKAADQDAVRAVAARTASRALRIATLGTVGTFGFIGAVGFYLSGYDTLDDAVRGTTTWASSWGKSFERLMGGDQAVSKTHPDVLATRHMDGEEELKYIYDHYIKEEVGDNDDTKGSIWEDTNDTRTDQEPTPTLYSIYEKYFQKRDDD